MSKTIKTWYTPNQAIKILKVSGIRTNRTTFIPWVKQYDLGHKVGGRWIIFRDRLEKFMKNSFHTGRIYAKKRQKEKSNNR